MIESLKKWNEENEYLKIFENTISFKKIKNESKIQNEYFVKTCKILKYKILLKMKMNKLEYDKEEESR